MRNRYIATFLGSIFESDVQNGHQPPSSLRVLLQPCFEVSGSPPPARDKNRFTPRNDLISSHPKRTGVRFDKDNAIYQITAHRRPNNSASLYSSLTLIRFKGRRNNSIATPENPLLIRKASNGLRLLSLRMPQRVKRFQRNR